MINPTCKEETFIAPIIIIGNHFELIYWFLTWKQKIQVASKQPRSNQLFDDMKGTLAQVVSFSLSQMTSKSCSKLIEEALYFGKLDVYFELPVATRYHIDISRVK